MSAPEPKGIPILDEESINRMIEISAAMYAAGVTDAEIACAISAMLNEHNAKVMN